MIVRVSRKSQAKPGVRQPQHRSFIFLGKKAAATNNAAKTRVVVASEARDPRFDTA